MAYISKKDLLSEIHKCKMTYCSYVDEKYCEFDHIFETFEDMSADALKSIELIDPNKEIVVRVMTDRHIPVEEDKKKRSRVGNSDKAVTNFPPFQHFVFRNGAFEEVLRSHWQGGFQNGSFSTDHGRTSNRLGYMFKKLVDNYARIGKFRGYSYVDEMKGNALTHLCAIALKFDESKSNNPFGFYSKSIQHCFVRVLNVEKRVQEIRDDLLQDMGVAPSITRQIDNEFQQRPEYRDQARKKLPPKRGRKTAVERAALEKNIKEEHELTK